MMVLTDRKSRGRYLEEMDVILLVLVAQCRATDFNSPNALVSSALMP